MIRLDESFFSRDALKVAPEIIGKFLSVKEGSHIHACMITEVEAYKGFEDKACHASKGKTSRNQVMFLQGGYIYVYLIYGMYWMFNIVTGKTNDPQAILIRGIEGFNGPGKLTRYLHIDGSYYGENICQSSRIWLADKGVVPKIKRSPRIGIEYAGEPWISKPWRFEFDS